MHWWQPMLVMLHQTPAKVDTPTVTNVYFGPSPSKLEWNVKSVRCTVLLGWTHQVLS